MDHDRGVYTQKTLTQFGYTLERAIFKYPAERELVAGWIAERKKAMPDFMKHPDVHLPLFEVESIVYDVNGPVTRVQRIHKVKFIDSITMRYKFHDYPTTIITIDRWDNFLLDHGRDLYFDVMPD